jgi:hypothetical protein
MADLIASVSKAGIDHLIADEKLFWIPTQRRETVLSWTGGLWDGSLEPEWMKTGQTVLADAPQPIQDVWKAAKAITDSVPQVRDGKHGRILRGSS